MKFYLKYVCRFLFFGGLENGGELGIFLLEVCKIFRLSFYFLGDFISNGILFYVVILGIIN